MPVVIKELVITATVDAAAPTPGQAPPAASLTRPAAQQLVQECVAQVLAVLHEQAER